MRVSLYSASDCSSLSWEPCPVVCTREVLSGLLLSYWVSGDISEVSGNWPEGPAIELAVGDSEATESKISQTAPFWRTRNEGSKRITRIYMLCKNKPKYTAEDVSFAVQFAIGVELAPSDR